MKPAKPVHEETWQASLGSQASEHLSAVFCDGEMVASVSGNSMYHEHSRARLAACAPEMARLLLKGLHCDDEQCCIACGAMTAHHYKEWSSHKSDCALVALLRKAGVLE